MEQQQNDPASLLQNHIVHSGFHNFLTKSGRKNLSNPEAHIDTVSNVRSRLREGNHDEAVNMLHGHPLGLENKTALDPIIRNISGSLVNSDINPESLKASVQYMHGALKGANRVQEHAKNVFEKEPRRKFDHEKLGALKNELSDLQANPDKVFDIANGVGHYLPGHNEEVGAHLATAVGYLNSIRPANTQGGPLDKILKPGPLEEYRYNRALEIAEDPLAVVHRAKDGTLETQDLVTVKTLYPKVAESIMQRATETLLEKHKDLTLKQKRSLSALLGEPLMFAQTPQSCQAIMKANAQGQQDQAQQKKSSKATAADLKQVDQVNKLYATPLQERQIDKKD